jgi:hypothetical protein
MTAALERGEWSAARPGPTLPPGKDPVPILQEDGWAPASGWTDGNLVPAGIRSRTVQPVVSRYTDWAAGPTVGSIHNPIIVHKYTRGAKNIEKEIKQYQKKWQQHVQRMDTNRLPKQALQYKPEGRKNIGRPRKRWRDQLHLEDYPFDA